MPRELPVGVAQSLVLKALGERAHTWSQAEAIFEEYGIVVSTKRAGRTSVLVVRERRQKDLGGWTESGDYERVPPLPSKLAPEQREALACYWQD
jgi:hypothetical protein